MSNTTHIVIIHNGVQVTGAEIRTPTRDIHINNAEDGRALEAMFYRDHGINRYTGNAEGADITITKIVDGHYGVAIENNGNTYSDIFRTQR